MCVCVCVCECVCVCVTTTTFSFYLTCEHELCVQACFLRAWSVVGGRGRDVDVPGR